MKPLLTVLLITLFSITATVAAPEDQPPAEEIDWDTLIPEDFRPDKIMEQFGDINELSDDDPRTATIMKELKEVFASAPVVSELDGKHIKLPGFVVPLEGDGRKVREFLLVPYYGACIHTPPPPANQTIYVKVSEGDAKIRQAFDTVWVTGTLSVESIDSDLATAGYQLKANKVEPYEE